MEEIQQVSETLKLKKETEELIRSATSFSTAIQNLTQALNQDESLDVKLRNAGELRAISATLTGVMDRLDLNLAKRIKTENLK